MLLFTSHIMLLQVDKMVFANETFSTLVQFYLKEALFFLEETVKVRERSFYVVNDCYISEFLR